MGKKNKKETRSIILKNLEPITASTENTKEEIFFDDFNESVQEEAKIKAKLQKLKNKRETSEKIKSVPSKKEVTENRFLITHKDDKEIHDFDKANQHYLKIEEIFLAIKKNGFKNIDLSSRRQLHFHCLCLLEELKALKNQMDYPVNLAKRIKLLRNIFAKRKDGFFGKHAVIEDFISPEESSLLKIVLNTFDHTRHFIKTNTMSNTYNPALHMKNGIYAKVHGEEIVDQFDLPEESPLAYLAEIKDLIGIELRSLMRTSTEFITLDEFLKNPETQINALSIVIEIGILALTFRNYYPELCRDDSDLNLSLKEGMLLLTLHIFKDDEWKSKEEKLTDLLQKWPFSEILATCIEVRNVYCHRESKHNKVENIDPMILFYLTGNLYKKVLPELKTICKALEEFEAKYEAPRI